MLFPRNLRRLVSVAIVLVFLVNWSLLRRTHGPATLDAQAQYPLLNKYINGGRGSGGAWHLPQKWTEHSNAAAPFKNIVQAAQFAMNRSSSEPQGQIPHSNIPRIIHQTWKDTRMETWPQSYRDSAEKWLGVVDEGDIPYIFWDDNGVAQFMRHFEPDIEADFYGLPSNVERSDVFRILVCKWIGGVYVDMDTEPLQPPADWITETDLVPWTDPVTKKLYQSRQPVNAIVGIEADTDPTTDTYWRMGYFFPVQLTQWSFAFAPHHPILQIFIDRLLATIRLVARDQQTIPDQQGQGIEYIDPVNLTGPIAFTDSVKTYLEGKADLRWNAVTGLQDGGKSKFVEDVLVLPITGFSPGSGRFRNMGSKPITDPSARLYHHAQGSWRKWSLKVEMGKFCRTAFGLCKDWSKVSTGDNYLW
ncbi:glycosyltransferase family 32 protein [Aspergillus undulatus]|uniref:glycosyltransferase family 32 protein n=1 Tax=Aspergillus undulatus TaxID=1810928 RepID=UPI003CCE0C3F